MSILAATLACAVTAPSIDERLAAIEAEIAQLTTIERSHLISAVAADAAAHSTLDAGLHAGWDDGFFIASSDRAFRAELSGQMQTRFVLNDRSTETRWGFENRRTKLRLAGHVLDPRLEYSTWYSFDDEDGTLAVQSYAISWALDDAWTISVGKARPRVVREQLVSATAQLAVERSLISSQLGLPRTSGFMLDRSDDVTRLTFGLMDAGDDFTIEAWNAWVRGEVALNGTRATFRDFTSPRDGASGTYLGAALYYQHDADRTNTTPRERLVRWSADIAFEFGGASLFIEVVGNHATTGDTAHVDQYGLVAQGGVFVTDATELFTRYERGNADNGSRQLSVITAGLNHYVAGNDLKWTVDAGYALGPVDPFWATGGAGWTADADEGEVVIRSQLQLRF